MIFQDNALVVGLTGMSGAGKTTACAVFRECGYAVVNCDETARRVTEAGKPALREIAAYFGGEILFADGTLDRRRLGRRVFSDAAARLALNKIIYPYISYEIVVGVINYIDRGERLILLDAPTLFESGADALCDRVVTIVAARESCIARITARDRLTEREAADRLSSQLSAEEYRLRSDHCIENNGTEAALCERVKAAAERIKTEVTGTET
ncbi:MAG: dephospho-CoA kinase [Bacteroides sp.]|nr:dephospho-CoA kinase [Eubacterium sp.]MCM1417885.1 dephospho-CoA kinase [Roseburia sp.]MCM1461951.1 dephospho-CoA kinase [Bacteroides sp.]